MGPCFSIFTNPSEQHFKPRTELGPILQTSLKREGGPYEGPRKKSPGIRLFSIKELLTVACVFSSSQLDEKAWRTIHPHHGPGACRVFIHICMCMYTYIHAYMRIYLYIYIYIHIHIQIHIHLIYIHR